MPFRRTVIAACGVGAILGTSVASPARAGEPATDKSAGTASATATSYKVNPTTASLSIGVTFGISLAGYTNQVSQAESRGIDLGIIGTTLAAQGCDGGDPSLPADKQPQPLRADSREGSGAKSEQEQISGRTIPVITKEAVANPSPYAEANTTTAPLAATGSIVAISGAHSRAVTQLSKGTRQSLATVDIASVAVPGVLEVAGLHWRAQSQSGAVDDNKGSFSIGALTVVGKSLPTADPIAALVAANKLLAPVGLQFVVPEAHRDAGIQFVDPLMLRVVPSPTRDAITGGVLGTAQPVREDLYDALLKQDCGNATYITVSDIAVGSITGAGSFSVELGGVAAKAEPLKATSFLGGLPSFAKGVVDDVNLGGFTAFDSNNSIGVQPGAPVTTTLDDGAGRGPSLAAAGKGSRGGKMALVGLLGLVGLLLFAERDRRMMRRAQRIA